MKSSRYPVWSPRIWHGMLFSDWLRLAARNRFRVYERVPLAVSVTMMAAINSALHLLQRGIYGRAVAATKIETPPLFIIGHWRAGTTLLHELFALDARFAFPTTYECFAPNHFLLTGRILPRLLGFLLPPRRPMDEMEMSFSHPQEDEFALAAMGAPSPILRAAFPNHPPPYLEFLDMEGVPEADLARWKSAMVRFVQMQTYRKQKALVLKSPGHTGRVAVLADLFPGAKFVHVVRHPLAVIPSTRRLWRTLDLSQGFQVPRHDRVDEFIFDAFTRMYRAFERQRPRIAPRHLSDVRYEDLIENPVRELERIYSELDLGSFELLPDRVQQYFAARSDYQVRQYDLSPRTQEEIRHQCRAYMAQYEYE